MEKSARPLAEPSEGKRNKYRKENVTDNMDYDTDEVQVTKPAQTRKRKEDTANETDSESNRVIRRKKKHTVHSSAEECNESERKSKDTLMPAEELINFCKNIGDNVNARDIKFIKKMATEAYKLFRSMQEENKILKEKLAKTDNIGDKLNHLATTITGAIECMKTSKCQAEKPEISYADKVKVRSSVVPQQAVKPPRHVITVFPRLDRETNSSDTTKKAIIASIAPVKEKLKIRNIKKISNNGVLIETETKEDLENILNNDKLHSAGLRTGLPAKRKPRMIIYNISKDLEEKEIVTAIRSQNLEDIEKTKFSDDFQLLFKTGDRTKETVNWVAEVTPEIRDTLKKRNRVFVGWNACYIQDFVSVSRCYKCQAFGHVAKFCRATQETCGHCAQDGHTYKTCSNLTQKPSCVNCKRANKPHDHSSRNNNCPAYKNAMESHLAQIDYGL